MIEDILKHASPKNVGFALLGLLVLVKVVGWMQVELKIRGLGGHAPRIKTWLPLG